VSAVRSTWGETPCSNVAVVVQHGKVPSQAVGDPRQPQHARAGKADPGVALGAEAAASADPVDEHHTPAMEDTAPDCRPGRHLAPSRWQRRELTRRSGGAYATPLPAVRQRIMVAAVGLAVVLSVVLVANAISGGERRSGSVQTTTTLDVLGPPPTPPAGPAAFGNLVRNWSFEQDLSGWGVVGPATASREPQGRTSGSSAAVRATGPQPSQVGLVLVKVVPSARRGSRYVASAWVRSTPPGLKVTVQLVASGGGSSQASQAVAPTLPGDRWRRVSVAHAVAAAQATLDLRVMAAEVRPGEALLIDEVEVRAG
jgi:hypothetical protein